MGNPQSLEDGQAETNLPKKYIYKKRFLIALQQLFLPPIDTGVFIVEILIFICQINGSPGLVLEMFICI